MGLKKILKKTAIKFNPMKFIGADHIKKNAGFIKELYDEVLHSKDSIEQGNKSFEELIRAAGMTEVDLQKRIKFSRFFIWVGGTVFLLLCCYAIFLFVRGEIFSGIMTAVIAMLLASYVWREHFMMIQLRYRRARLTLREWFHLTVKSK